MICRVDTYNTQLEDSSQQIKISVELEKPAVKSSMHKLLLIADVVSIITDSGLVTWAEFGAFCVKHSKEKGYCFAQTS